MKKIAITILSTFTLLTLTGCTTLNNLDEKNAQSCAEGTNYAGTALGAVGGAVVGSMIGSGTGKVLATVGGAVAGGYAGNKSGIGC